MRRPWLDSRAGTALALTALPVAVVAGWANLHSDDMGMVAGLLFIASAAYGAILGARRAWAAGALFAASIPVSQLASVVLAMRVPFGGPPSWAAVVLPAAIALSGAYAGAGIRAVTRPADA